MMVLMVRMVMMRMVMVVTSQERYATPPSCAVKMESMLGLKKGSLRPRKSWMLSTESVWRVVESAMKRSRSRMGKANP